MKEILENKSQKMILLGNEAIVRGALESGVQFVSTYPGTPASEIGNIFFRIARETGVYFEFSTNEKVALEAGTGASFSGLKVLVVMKHFGLNVCSDSLIPLCYTGTKGPLVLFVADDPSCWSSAQSEQNSRAYSFLAHIPTLEPSEPQECRDFIKLAFEISERFKIPVMVRTTTRVSHQSAAVKAGELETPIARPAGKFVKDPQRFTTMPPGVLRQKKELLEKINKIREFSEKSKINPICTGVTCANLTRTNTNLGTGIITSGISYLYVMEALKELKINLPVLKLGFFYPLPQKKIKNFIKKLKKVLVVEELEPYLEKAVERLSKDTNPNLKIFGKKFLPEVGELKPENVLFALSKFSGKKIKFNFEKHFKEFQQIDFPKRFPQLCSGEIAPPGCPYWLVFSAIKKAAPQNTVFGGDIGCYMIAAYPPHFLQDYLSSMGSSIGIAHGIKKVSSQKVIALIGDSTFFHAGIPALINTVFNKSNPLIIILNNQTTAMTGHQPHPGSYSRTDSDYKFAWAHSHTPKPSDSEDEGGLFACIKIEEIIRACGVKNLKVIDPQNFSEMVSTIKEFLEKKEVSVIIARRICALLAKSLKPR